MHTPSRFQALYRQAPLPYQVMTLEGRLQQVNAAWEKLFGINQAEAAGQAFAAWLTPHSQDTLANGLKNLEPHGTSSALKLDAVHPTNGRRFHCELHARIDVDTTTQERHVLGILTDVTEHVRNTSEMRTALARLSIGNRVFESTRNAVMITDAGWLIVDVNPAFTAITGYSREEALGRTPRFLDSGLTAVNVYDDMQRQLQHNGHWEGEVIHRNKNGSVSPEFLSVTRVSDAEPAAEQHHVFVLSHLHQLRDDVVTGLPTKALLRSRLGQAMAHCRQTHETLAFLCIGIDQLSDIQMAFGYAHGDLLLRQVADRLKNLGALTHKLFHAGSHELGVICHPVTSLDALNNLTHSLQQLASEPVVLPHQEVPITLSIGIALYPGEAQTVDALSDQAYQAKALAQQRGGGRQEYFEPGLQAQAQERHRLTTELQLAVRDRQLSLVYQPIVDLDTGKVQKVEALIRWNHPSLGTIGPDVFIRLAEQSGLLIKEIGEWVFSEAIGALQKLRRHAPDLQMGINISPVHFLHKDFRPESLIALLTENALPGNAIILEFTEGFLLDADDTVRERLQLLRHFDIELAIDDFGTGFSSLSYLHKFHFDYLKIDRSFLQSLHAENRNAVLCGAIISMGHALGLKVVAEGIETPEQYAFMQALHCDFGQGFGIARPQALEAVEKSLHH